MDKKDIHFKTTPRGYQVFEGETLIGQIKTLKSGKISVDLKKEEQSLEKKYISVNEAVRASINFIKNE